jgi:hypothetical protein
MYKIMVLSVLGVGCGLGTPAVSRQNILFPVSSRLTNTKTTVLPVVLQLETWFLTLREEHKLRVYEENIWTKERGSNRRTEKVAQ